MLHKGVKNWTARISRTTLAGFCTAPPGALIFIRLIDPASPSISIYSANECLNPTSYRAFELIRVAPAKETTVIKDQNAQRDYEIELIKHLRKEAYDVKHCFTLFSFQALALVTAVLGIAIKFYDDEELIGLIGIPLTLFLVTIARIGTHKFETANRLTGFELHLQRTSRYPTSGAPGWDDRMRGIGWEEALRAWRIVQATLFEYLYRHGNLRTANPNPSLRDRLKTVARRRVMFWRSDRLLKCLVDSKGKEVVVPTERWFQTRTHLETGMAYAAGGYLKTMLHLIYMFSILCGFFAATAVVRTFKSAKPTEGVSPVLIALIVLVFGYYIFGSLFETYARRKLLESGLLSINSCAVLWQVTIGIHFATLAELSIGSEADFESYEAYSKTLGRRAVDFCDHVFSMYEWYRNNRPAQIGGRTAMGTPPQDSAPIT